MIKLRTATLDDCARIWRWNFAPDVRALSRSSGEVSLDEHARWFAARIASEAPMWVIEDDAPLGVVRIDPNGRISIALDARARGRGVGRRAVGAACARWARPVTAEVLVENAPSRACFEACGFVAVERTADVITYHWSP